ncbi:hypothetical protein A2U01_0061129, partial [Trifolium medium]|nr:hypothetical protein [Trifolium medium]
MVNSSPILNQFSTGSVSRVIETLIDNNLSPGLPLSDEQDLVLDSETVVPAHLDPVSKFERFDLATIVRSPKTTVNLGSASPLQYFSGPHCYWCRTPITIPLPEPPD